MKVENVCAYRSKQWEMERDNGKWNMERVIHVFQVAQQYYQDKG
jgi:hypothetical protein